jgi:hypothetical protein
MFLALLGYGYTLLDTTRRYERNGVMMILDKIVATEMRTTPVLIKEQNRQSVAG